MQEKINTFLQEIKNSVDREIDDALNNQNNLIDGLYKSATYSAGGGKRVRAVYTHLVGKLFEVEEEKVHRTACAVEMIHAASLIMDDLPYMDDSQLRRGKPANHVVFGQDVALCASIALLGKANELILADESLGEKERIEVTRILNQSYGFDGLAAGQFVDLKLKRKNVDFSIIEFINSKKTAALFTAAGKAAAVLGKANQKQMEAITTFSDNIGFAFQIIDDLLDVSGDKNVIGKDVAQDKMNFVKLVGEQQAQEYAGKYTKKALDALDVFGKKADELRGFSNYLMNRVS